MPAEPQLSPSPRRTKPPLSDEQQRLAVAYMPMARALARPFKEQFPDIWEEFESAACFALVDAARTFDPGRSVKFPTFARQRIWGALRDVRRGRIERANFELPSAESAEVLGLIAEDRRTPGDELEAIEAVEWWLRKLPRKHADACRMIYLDGATHAEAGERQGLSPSRITFLHLEALAILGGTWAPGVRPMPWNPPRKGRRRQPAPEPSPT